jgi:hypothetical protein
MQGATGKAAAERSIERRHAQPHAQAQPRLPARPGGPGHHAPQGVKGFPRFSGGRLDGG